MEFNYYYGTQADQFSFIKIPKVMITDPMFSKLSLPAKVLYGILLDRMSLSMKNRWFDSKNRVYIIYQIADIQEDMGISKNKAIDLLRSLEEFGLIEKKRRGLGMPSLLYVKSFLVEKDCSALDGEQSTVTDNGTTGGHNSTTSGRTKKQSFSGGKSENTRSVENQTLESEILTVEIEVFDKESKECEVLKTNNKEKKNINHACTCPKNFEGEALRSSETGALRNPKLETSRSSETGVLRNPKLETSRSPETETLRSIESQTLRSPKSETSRSFETGFLINKTNNSNTDSSESYPIQSNHTEQDEIGCENFNKEYQHYKAVVCENIDYNTLLVNHTYDRKLIEGIVDLILEMVMCQNEKIVVASNIFPREVVKSRFLKLDYTHIEYVLHGIHANTTKVKNIKKYLLAALFNAPSTIDGYYRAEVNHDFPEFAE